MADDHDRAPVAPQLADLVETLAREALVADRQYLGIQRSDEVVLIQITLNLGRTVEQKRGEKRSD